MNTVIELQKLEKRAAQNIQNKGEDLARALEEKKKTYQQACHNAILSEEKKASRSLETYETSLAKKLIKPKVKKVTDAQVQKIATEYIKRHGT
ncbi:MAG: hypothetical protein ACI8Y7_000439 [Candidatus Woesearchaeota archaeon]|jgi:hypothetical protein